MTCLRFLIAAAALLVAAAVSASSPSTVLTYGSPARSIEEALVIGNGTSGAVICGGTVCDTLLLNDIPGTLSIEYLDNGIVTGYSRSLDEADAVATTRYVNGGSVRETRYFASAPDSVIVISVHSDGPFNAIVRMDSQLPHTTVAAGDRLTTTGYTGTRFTTVAAVRVNDPQGRHEVQRDGAIQLIGCRDVDLIVASATSSDGSDPARLASSRVDAAMKLPADSLLARHKARREDIAPVINNGKKWKR